MSTADTKALIEEAVASIQKEVPALQKLKLVVELELRGRGDIQLFRVQVPGPKITRDIASDAKVRLSVPRSHFNELAKEGKIRHWREAFESGHVKATGPVEILKLIQSVIERQEERSRTRKLRDADAGGVGAARAHHRLLAGARDDVGCALRGRQGGARGGRECDRGLRAR